MTRLAIFAVPMLFVATAVQAHVTVGEITAALEAVFGTWTERAVA